MALTQWPIDANGLSFLQAVNRLIASTGAEPVTQADPALDSDVALAIGFLNVWNLNIQSRGWAWNTEEKLPLSLNTDGTISIPANVLSVVAAYWADLGAPALVAQRGAKLYDLINHTFIFTAPIQVDIIARQDWDDLPAPAQNLIAGQAMYEFQSKKQGSGLVSQIDQFTLRMLWGTMENLEDNARRASQIGGNLSVMRVLYGSGIRRSRGVF